MFGKLFLLWMIELLGTAVVIHHISWSMFEWWVFSVPVGRAPRFTKLGTSSLGVSIRLVACSIRLEVGLKQHVEFLSRQNGSAWKWGPTWRQTPFPTPEILGNKNSTKSWWSTFGHLPPPKSPVQDLPPATPQVDSTGQRCRVLRSHNPPACCMVLPCTVFRSAKPVGFKTDLQAFSSILIQWANPSNLPWKAWIHPHLPI